MRTITYHPYFDDWEHWMDGIADIGDGKIPFDFISEEISIRDDVDGIFDYDVPTIVLADFSVAGAARALADWYSKCFEDAITVHIMNTVGSVVFTHVAE